MPDSLTLNDLQNAIKGTAAALRCRRRLQPAGGEGDKVFPPTFAGAVYGVEQRRVPSRDQAVTCVLLDSVQSQANRMELALQEAIDSGKIKTPLLVVDFTEHGPTEDIEADEGAGRLIDAIGKVTSLQVPHRLADAILRDSQIDGVDFRKSQKGKALNTVSLANATPLFELCPTALVFGMWDSTGPKGGLGPKFERAMVSEIVGIGAEVHDSHRARGVRRDPLEIRKTVRVLKNPDGSLKAVAEPDAKGAVAPSEVVHGNIPFDIANAGVTIEYAEQVTTLSLICLRRLRFPISGSSSPDADVAARTVLAGVDQAGARLDQAADADVAARTVLAALGLCAATLAFETGVGLRSRCLLWPDGPMEWDLLDRPGTEPAKFSLTGDQAIILLGEAIDAAKAKALPWQEESIVLKPSPELLKLVRLSQLQATKEGPDEGK